MENLRRQHKEFVKKVFVYLHGTSDYAICYQEKLEINKKIFVHGFFNFYWDKDLDHKQSVNGYIFELFSGASSWMSRRNSIIELSTTKAK